MRGRFATECHYTQRQIDDLEMPDVWKMARYWKLEPPVSRLLALRYGYQAEPEPEVIAVAPRNIVPFEKLAPWLQKAMIKKSGKTEEQYMRDVKAARKAAWLAELEKVRKEKANG